MGRDQFDPRRSDEAEVRNLLPAVVGDLEIAYLGFEIGRRSIYGGLRGLNGVGLRLGVEPLSILLIELFDFGHDIFYPLRDG